MTDIDWSKAPEGFPIWIESLNEDYVSEWHREEEHLYRDRTGKVWMKEAVEYSEIIVHKPHRSAVWTGSGLPPVGTVCECQDERFHWQRGTIVHVGKGDGAMVAVMQADNGILIGESGEFRQLRAPEQIAAEEREKAIKQIQSDLDVPLQIARRAYDQGYRRVEQ